MSARSSSPRNGSNKAFSIPSWAMLLSGFILGNFHGRYFPCESDDDSALVYSANSVSSASSSLSSSGVSKSASSAGWRQIDVFYGKAPFVANRTWFSQASQDELIIGLLRGKKNGYFVDLAANDATLFSNTYALERNYDWTGICIEPNPLYWRNLSHYRSCQTVAAVVGSELFRPVWFRFEAGDHGGIAGDGFDNGKRWQRFSEPAYTIPLVEILRRYDSPKVIDYLSLDVEGAETLIMNSFPLSDYRIKIITAERLKGGIRVYLKSHGYEFIKRLTRWGESLWVHSSVRDELDWSVLEKLGFPLA